MIAWILTAFAIVSGIVAVWALSDRIAVLLKRKRADLPEMSVDRKAADEMGLDVRLESQGYRLFWGNRSDRDYYLHFDDYALIEWSDPQGKSWLLTPVDGGDVPLKTKFTPDEIEARRAARKRAIRPE